MTSSRPAEPHTPGMAMPRPGKHRATLRCPSCGRIVKRYPPGKYVGHWTAKDPCGECEQKLGEPIETEANDG